jgi:hypothetical protein
MLVPSQVPTVTGWIAWARSARLASRCDLGAMLPRRVAIQSLGL